MGSVTRLMINASEEMNFWVVAHFVMGINNSKLGALMNKIRARLGGAFGLILVTAKSAWAQSTTTLSDPQGSGPIVSAVQWLQGTLLGTVATVVAVIAIACVGFMMLTGRMNWRHGGVVILGCFILFGAVSIVAGIRSTASFAG